MKAFSNLAKLFVFSLVATEIIAQTPNFVPNTNAPLDQRVGAIENYIVSSQQGGTNVQSPAAPMTTYPAAVPQGPMAAPMINPIPSSVVPQQNPVLIPNQMVPAVSPMLGIPTPTTMPVAQTGAPMAVQVPVAPVQGVAAPTMPSVQPPAMENAPAAA